MTFRILFTTLTVVAAGVSASAGAHDALDSLTRGDIVAVRISLNPWGPHLGFAADIAGDDPRLAPVLKVISGAEPAPSHKCANRGAIRFEMSDGRTIAVGLLPSHEAGFYDLRLYDDGRLEGLFRVQRDSILSVLGGLDVPVDDPAFSD